MVVVRSATHADVAAVARVHVDSWRSSYQGLLPDEYLASLSYLQRERLWDEVLSQPESARNVYVAEDSTAGIVGFASGGPQRSTVAGYDGELYAIYLLAGSQGQGLGRRLVAHVAAGLSRMGLGSMVVWVFAANSARCFYEALDGRHICEQPMELGGHTFDEVAYGWTDLQGLMNADKHGGGA